MIATQILTLLSSEGIYVFSSCISFRIFQKMREPAFPPLLALVIDAWVSLPSSLLKLISAV